ncbi:MAG: hypothetical protein IJ158_13585 [Treponema sp.]|nr:hypothetical protein [Treponema sp.]
MHDFSCTNPDDMKLGLLAEKTRYFKKDEKGRERHCDGRAKTVQWTVFSESPEELCS